jgi:Ca2+-transporting ATPase
MTSLPLHTLRVADVYKALETSASGLTSEEAQVRLRTYGPNALAEPRGTPHWRRFLGHITPDGLAPVGGGRPIRRRPAHAGH